MATARASDCDGDGAPDGDEVAAGAPDCNGNGVPDACDLAGTPFGISEVSRISSGVLIFGIDAADLDGDGMEDVAACASDSVQIFLQRAGGEFESRQFPPSAGNGIRAVDLDGDGDVDLAIDASVLVVLENSGAGVFTNRGVHGGGTGHAHATAVDIDSDGDVDIVSITRDGTGVSILPNEGNGTFPTQDLFGASFSPAELAVADLDGDGDRDLAVASNVTTEVIVFSNTDGRRAFEPRSRIPFDFVASGLLAADLDGTGGAELLASAVSPGRVCIFRRDGDGFATSCWSTRADQTFLLHAGDLNGDGAADVLHLDNASTCAPLSAVLREGDGRGGFGAPLTADLGRFNGATILHDVMGDPIPEMIAAESQPGQALRVFRIGPGAPLPDCDRNGVPDECDVGLDWNFNERPDSCDIEAGLPDCDRNGIPDAQDPDCDENGRPDACDIAAGALQDLDSDGFPDICEPVPFLDCNENGIEDDADLSSGTSADCNANGVPDECDLRRYVAEPEPTLQAGSPPVGVALPDLDGDGLADAAILRVTDVFGTESTRKTSLRLHRNGVKWSRGWDVPAAAVPLHIRSGDIDGNGSQDLLISSREMRCVSRGFISALHNRGHAHMEPPRVFARGLSPTSLELGDLDGDGDLDVAFAGEDGAHRIFIFLNDGAGRFDGAPGGSMVLPGLPSDLAASDLDGDFDLDLAASLLDPPSVAVFRNAGDGMFAAAPVLPASFPPFDLAAADLEGRDSMDLVIATGPTSANAIFLFENDGAGTFGNERLVPMPVSARVVHAFDADGDGIDDLALAGSEFVPGLSPDGEAFLHVRSLGGRRFDAPWLLDRGTFISGIAAGDTDADGYLDIAAADVVETAVRFYGNAGREGFDRGFRHPVGDGISALIASDLDRDGHDDVVVASMATEDITVLASPGGKIAGGRSMPLEFSPRAVLAGDLDGDGDGDLAAAGGLAVQPLIQERAGSYLRGAASVLSSSPLHAVGADLDGDGDLDVATANVLLGSGFNDNVSFLANDGSGGFGTPRNFGIGIHPRALCAADLDSDGDIDLVTSNSESESTLSFLWNRGAGDFGRADTRPWREMRGLLATDLDGDGLKELIGAAIEGVSILENGGGGAFLDRLVSIRDDGWPLIDVTWYGFAGADLEDDGDIDLVLADTSMLLLLENRGGDFPSTPEAHVWRSAEGAGASGSSSGEPSLLLALPDLDGNGRRDVALSFPFGSEILILHDRGQASRDLDLNGIPDECLAPGVPFRRGEVNGDGAVDLSDAISVLRWLFAAGDAIGCVDAADDNDDARVDLSDPVWLLRHLFLGEPPPHEPFLSCGDDPTPDTLGCDSFPACEGF